MPDTLSVDVSSEGSIYTVLSLAISVEDVCSVGFVLVVYFVVVFVVGVGFVDEINGVVLSRVVLCDCDVNVFGIDVETGVVACVVGGGVDVVLGCVVAVTRDDVVVWGRDFELVGDDGISLVNAEEKIVCFAFKVIIFECK